MRSLTTAAWGIRTYWRSAFVLVVTLVAALAVSLTVSSWILPDYPILAPRFSLPIIPSWDAGVPWGPKASFPAALQWTAMVQLFRSLLSQTAIVCVIATVTILGVSFARASARADDVAVRRAVGAARGTIVRSALFEIAAIALIAVSVGGLIGTIVGTRALRDWQGVIWPASVFSVAAVVMTVMLVLAADAALTAAPAWRRVMPPPLSKTPLLGVAAIQLGLSIVGLAAGDGFRRGLHHLHQVQGDHGATRGALYQLSAAELAPEARARAYDTVLRRLAADSVDASLESPGARLGLGVTDLDVGDCGRCRFGLSMTGRIPLPVTHFLVSPDSFRMLSLNVLSGRGIDARDGPGAPLVAVVSRSVVGPFLSIGRRLSLAGKGPPRWYTIVGVVDDRVSDALVGPDASGPSVYLSALQHPAENVELLVRPRRAADELPDVTAVARSAGLRVTEQLSERAAFAREVAPLAWFARVLDWEGWVAIVLACLGAGALMLIWVHSIRAELGIRRAVGATRRRIVGYVLARAVGVAIVGVVIARWLGGLVWYWITTVMPTLPDLTMQTLLRVSAIMVGTALVAAALPAWRASRVSPAALSQSE